MSKLIRKHDGLIKEGKIEFVEWDKNNRGKYIHMNPKEGFSCIVDRVKSSSVWITPIITEVISNTEFKTKNYHYIIKN